MFEMVLFDFDGTLIEFNVPFVEVRRKLRIEKPFVLEAILEMPEEERRRAFEVLEFYELKAAERANPMPYARELLNFLDERGIVKGVVTRNSRKSVEIAARRFGFKLDFVISREDAEPKPSPEPILLALNNFGVRGERAIIVGDFIFDLMAGRRAGVKTALIVTEKNRGMVESFKSLADYIVHSLKEIEDIVKTEG